MLTADEARESARGWARPGGSLAAFAATGVIACRSRLLAEVRPAYRECVATAAQFGPYLIDDPDALEEIAGAECEREAARLLDLGEWLRAAPSEGCRDPRGCPCTLRPIVAEQHA